LVLAGVLDVLHRVREAGTTISRNAERASSVYSATTARLDSPSIAARHSRSWSGIEPRGSSVLLAA
jgi:hypothetical protein